MRCPESKLTTVRALQSCGFDTIAAGDSFNDLAMIQREQGGLPVQEHRGHQGRPPGPAGVRGATADLLAAIKRNL